MFLLVDKSKGVTSHDVVNSVRKITGEKRVGHAGTLDPNATGLLIIAVGRDSTKKLDSLTNHASKTYLATLMLGEERDSDDIEGRVINKIEIDKINIPSSAKVVTVLNSFVGEQKQIPPIFSAIKVKGRKSYQLARKGNIVELKPRTIMIHSIKLIDYEFPKLIIDCDVSSGTYIRAIARDVGRKLNMYGYLEDLRRTKIGDFKVDNAVDLHKLKTDNWIKYAIEL
ncbi:tRNA pseudouridine(55) synthase TruB [Candidatus Woesebacteria bacterium]|nr:MAG: tRNA pseudouridine(55) synthase TruB [Candidatus Woesebacteria bacterium]